MRLAKLHTPQLEDTKVEQVRRQHELAITALQKLPAASAHVIANVELVDGVATPIGHKLGRAPTFVRESCVRGAVSTGRIEEIRSKTYDPTRVVVLKATGMGATVTVDVLVM